MDLPDPNEPLVLADGTKINPKNGKVVRESTARGGFVEIPSAGEAQAIVARTRRSVADLPVVGNGMNALSLVLLYSIWGLNDQDISIQTSLSVDQVKNIKKLSEYKKLSDDILKNVLEYEANDIRTFFAQNASKAAQKIVNIADQEDGALGFKASQDILDRAGYRPADVHEHRVKMDALQIEVIEKKSNPDIPQIDQVIPGDYRDVTPEKKNGRGSRF